MHSVSHPKNILMKIDLAKQEEYVFETHLGQDFNYIQHQLCHVRFLAGCQ